MRFLKSRYSSGAIDALNALALLIRIVARLSP